MSQFTISLKELCESLTGHSLPVDYEGTEQVIKEAIPKIFENYPLFDENYREILNEKIVKHFYFQEISEETFAKWKFMFNRTLNEIMPYYNQMYKTTLLEFNPLYTFDVTREHEIKSEGDSKSHAVSLDRNTSEGGSQNKSVFNASDVSKAKEDEVYSDTPQGRLDLVKDGKYATSATYNNKQGESQQSGLSNDDRTFNSKDVRQGDVDSSLKTNTVEKYLERVYGKSDSASYSRLVKEYRQTILNIDMLVIGELENLFMGLWQ